MGWRGVVLGTLRQVALEVEHPLPQFTNLTSQIIDGLLLADDHPVELFDGVFLEGQARLQLDQCVIHRRIIPQPADLTVTPLPAMLQISNNVTIPEQEIELSAIRAQGAGGQNVNKVSSAVHLRFDISASSLPDHYKQRLLALKDSRINKDGVVIIKAQRFRSQEKNREDALTRLAELIRGGTQTEKRRIATKPSRGAKRRRADSKTQRGQTKRLRGKVDY